MIFQMLKFGIVGMMATGLHLLVGLTMISSGWSPILSNAMAFLVAFSVSFIGHLGFSFSDHDADIVTAAWRFGLTALAGFAVNQALLVLLLRHFALRPAAALCLSTASAAALTFLLSRYWAFRHRTFVTKPATEFTSHHFHK